MLCACGKNALWLIPAPRNMGPVASFNGKADILKWVIYESAASVKDENQSVIGAGRQRSVELRYTSSNRREDRSTLESEPSAHPVPGCARKRKFPCVAERDESSTSWRKAENSRPPKGGQLRRDVCARLLSIVRSRLLCIGLVHESSIRPNLGHEHLRPGFRNHSHSFKELESPTRLPVLGRRHRCRRRLTIRLFLG